MSTNILLSTMPCRREPFNSLVRPARKPAVFAASFQPLGAGDIKASFQRGKRVKRLYFHTVSIDYRGKRNGIGNLSRVRIATRTLRPDHPCCAEHWRHAHPSHGRDGRVGIVDRSMGSDV